jgi:4-amino-4-deoxy-L-arabinose transferase-like glycosyltransferase
VQLLDYGSLCFNALALYGIARWLEKQGNFELLLMTSGIALAANCKQISAFFIVTPCLVLFFLWSV